MEKTRTPTMKTTTKDPSLKLVKDEEEKKLKMKSSTCKVKFVGWTTNNPKNWEFWLRTMCSLHKSTWENAGIYEAIMSSTYTIKRQEDLIFELASRWCSKTNTFDFQWGDATLTLEDIFILGGYSVSGISPLTSIDNDTKSNQIKEQLELARLEIIRTKSKAASQTKWMEKFIGSESDIEHEAFLSLWLSRFVFPVRSCNSGISKKIFPVAAMLSRGIKVALGQVVLAMLYRELNFLKEKLRYTQRVDQSKDHVEQTNLHAQFHLVQIWAWERFPTLKPVQNFMYVGDEFPRLARWSNVKILKEKDLSLAIDDAEKSFLWCPYGDSGKQEVKNLKSFELIGFGSCIEKYQPQRVARQFGLDLKVLKGVEVIEVLDSESDSDRDCSISMTKVLKLPILKTGSSAFASPDVSVKDACSSKREKIPYDVDEDSEDEVVELQNSDMVSSNSNNEAVEVMKRSEDEGEVGDNGHDDIEDMEGRNNGFFGAESSDLLNEIAMSCDHAESFTNERSTDLEARISRLEVKVYAHFKALEAAR